VLIDILLVLVGLVILTKAADQFVIGAARLAVGFRISAVVIGAVVIGFGTSAPELLVTALAGTQGKVDIGVGNIIGSNVANISLVLGVAALVTPMAIRGSIFRREAPISVGSVLLFAVLVQGGFRVWEGIVLAVALLVALAVILRSAREDDPEMASEVEEYVDEGDELSMGRESLRTGLGLVATLGAAQVLVMGASGLTVALGLGEGFVGLTVVALGTSLPELVTAVQAARKGEHELIAGNLLGSNMFNSLAVGAAAAFTGPGPLADPTLAGLATVIMVVVALLSGLFMRTGHLVVRWEAGLLLGIYVVAVPLMAT
jgi:cation:H+ antiporter